MKLLYFLLSIFLCSCATVKHSGFKNQVRTSNCNQGNTYRYSKDEIPVPIYELTIDSILTSKLKISDINIANAIGILDLLPRYIYKLNEVKENNSLQNQIDLITIRQEIYNKIDLASLEISSVSAELDCEEERTSQIASYLKEKEKKTVTRLTVGSIILGSVSAITTGVLLSEKDESEASNIIGVGVGIADAFLGVMMLTHKRKIEFHHTRNVLGEIWRATETSTVYPASIWYYLNYRNPQNKHEKSLREQLIENWKNFEQVSSSNGKSKEESIDIYFGDGGEYTADQLENRANMYDQIESAIKLMKQDLRSVTLSMEYLK